MAGQTPRADIGVVSGTGYYDLGILEGVERVGLETPYGQPSDAYELGSVAGRRVAFLPRHGKGHSIPPHRVNFRANIWGFRMLGVRAVVGVNSMGSLRREIAPPCIVVPSDFAAFCDTPTFHDDKPVHVAPRLSETVRQALLDSAREARVEARDGGVALMTRGPRFETPAESRALSSIGDLVGMTMPAEAVLFAELGIPYANLASVDNYASGVEGSTPTMDGVLAGGRSNFEGVKRIVSGAVRRL